MMLETSDHPELVPHPVDEARYPSLDGKGVIITGGASGIGMYLVAAFCAQGARVGFIDIDGQAAERVAGVCETATGNRPAFAVADLRDIEALRGAVDTLRETCGPVQALVNNAGNDDRLPAAEVTPDYWDDRMAVNLRHQFFAAQALFDDLESTGGAIVNMGSTSWMQGAAGLIAYTTAKSAVQGMTKSLARELGPRGIRVNAIAPGWILTERQVSRAKAIYADKFDDYLTRQCLKSFLLPPDVARMTLFLAADDSRMITSQTFVVDGGVT
ncbi:SDR family NAD(P)-dependent oxidoreductase [Oceanomicrobium pacificus]|uniref:SDR family oxidoreductase n=1 Tax=Oceanomicrobium pacificus TaxID=2692916 RepID=A0A6B0TV40_9RHOB|nr:SDR family oxidoreductase [Oceanomicrobium pacificus]MXU65072.1 SDR family oxidoreductase [Oceanomicrobium pacificus]